MDIVETLRTDHGYLTILARRIVDELPRYVRSRPYATRRLRALVTRYIDYARGVHEPREAFLRDYLAARTSLQESLAPEDTAHDWPTIHRRLACAANGDERLDIRHRLAAALRDATARMQHEEHGLLACAAQRLSATERHALALRAITWGGAPA